MRIPGEDLPTERTDDDAVLVPRAAFEAFASWLDEQLAALEAQWSHLAAPSAAQPQRVVRDPGRQGLAGAADSAEA